jgi:hypothetical protein
MDNTQNPAPVSSSPMSDEDKMTQAIASSYVDDYSPPASQAPTATITDMPAAPTPIAADPIAAPDPVSTPEPVISAPSSLPEPVEPPVVPVASEPSPVAPSAPTSNSVSQALEDQNIFALLGLESASDDDKEAFLDELQQIIWEDFLENDVELLVTEEEMVEFKKISAKEGLSEEDKQSEMITFLEKLIPDLEKIMLEKALELKEEMFRERVTSMKETFADRADVQASVQKALDLIASQQWRAAADELNAIK